MSNTEYDPLGNANCWFLVGADILNLLIFCDIFIFCIYSKCEDLIKRPIFHFLLSLFYLKDWIVFCEDQMFYYSQNS